MQAHGRAVAVKIFKNRVLNRIKKFQNDVVKSAQ